MTVPAPASRNAPCPCGSGKRYKDCHGALGVAQGGAATNASGAAPPPDASTARRLALLGDALARQQAGELEAAMAGYEAVLAEAPDDFDALHMLGVVHYQRHAFDRAEALLRRAIARNPAVVSAHQNLALLLEARRLEAAEDALCREVLPRLAHLCAPPSAFAEIVASRRAIDLLDGLPKGASRDASFTALAQGAIGPARVHAPVGEAPSGQAVTPPAGALAAPVTILYGVAVPLAAFPAVAADAVRVLVVDRDAPSALHDRLRELSEDGRHPVHVRHATPALAAALRVPGGLLAPGIAPPTMP